MHAPIGRSRRHPPYELFAHPSIATHTHDKHFVGAAAAAGGWHTPTPDLDQESGGEGQGCSGTLALPLPDHQLEAAQSVCGLV
jgi:hypothetical protein